MKKLLICLGLLTLTLSCQSEFEKQVEKAKVLVSKRESLKAMLMSNNTNLLLEEIKKIDKEVIASRHISGNSVLFDEQISTFENNLNYTEQNSLITRFP